MTGRVLDDGEIIGLMPLSATSVRLDPAAGDCPRCGRAYELMFLFMDGVIAFHDDVRPVLHMYWQGDRLTADGEVPFVFHGEQPCVFEGVDVRGGHTD